MFGIPALQAAAGGTAQVNLQVAGSWAGWGKGSASGFAGPQVTGTADLHNVQATVKGASGPVEITSAELQLLSDQVRVEKLRAKAAGTLWSGALEMPRGCGIPGACEVHFNLVADKISPGKLSEWLSPQPQKMPWYRVLQSSPQAGTSFFGSLRASGRVASERLQIETVPATRVSAVVVLDRGSLAVPQLNADFLGGKYRGMWHADFSAKPALCSGSGQLDRVSLSWLGDDMKDAEAAGTGDATYEIQGPCLAGFWHSAEGTLRFDVKDGTLPHISLEEDGEPLRISRLSGQARLHAGRIEVKDAMLDSPSGKFLLSGTASLKRELDLTLARTASSGGTGGYAITGTLAVPRIVPLPGTEQARLKR